ncbi:MAG: NAD(P)/FAD-dependent oxidoreductase [Clostridiales bacterium]|nr:NAD(P)/FAD-dependent oxidoreductase [Clostridiales bacterium]
MLYDVAIIGCGIIGAAAAFELSRYDVSVVVLERENDVATGATKANSAIIHAGYDPDPGSLMASLNVRGNALIRRLCSALDVPFRQCGSLVLAFSRQEQAQLESLAQRGEANGVKDLEIIEQARLRELEAEVSDKVIAALYAPTAGIVSPWELTLALVECAVINAVDLQLENEVLEIRQSKGGFCLQTEKGPVEARYILNAAGLHSDVVHNMAAPPAFRIIPDRGEYYLLDKSEGERVRHILFQCPDRQGKGTLIAPTVHGNLIVGPNNEPPRFPEDTATTAEGLAEVAGKALRLVPSLNLGECIRTFAGVRAGADTPDFIIAEAAGTPGFLDLAGIKSPGLTAAPAVAEMAAALLVKSGLALRAKQSFHCERSRLRFANLSPEAKRDAVRLNPDYGRVVCRCETVTEGEILSSLRSPVPPRSLDGIKRRTAAGMGRCQGGFCGPRVMELLARETRVSPLAIPQEQRGSFLLTGETKAGR